MKNLKTEHHHVPEHIVNGILEKWLEGKVDGVPVTWESLIGAIRDSGLKVLANKVEKYARSPKKDRH